MRYEIEIRPKATKDLARIPKPDVKRISEHILAMNDGLVGDIKRLTNFTPEYRLRVGNWRVSRLKETGLPFIVSSIAKRLTDRNHMTAQIIEKRGRKEFAVIPYKDFVAMRSALEDYEDLKALRKAKADPRNKKGEPFVDAARRMGLVK